jgi:hypothetical protein
VVALGFDMVVESGRTAIILRRMKRKPLSIWAWAAYNPTRAQPGELKFELLDANERRTGEFVYTSFELKLLKPGKVTLMTPWGEAEIDIQESRPRILMSGREIARLGGGLLQKGFDLKFPDGKTVVFKTLKGGKNNIQYAYELGSVTGVEERGTLPEGTPSRSIQMTPEEIKMLPKAERPRSIETRDYVQFRISVSGKLPVNEDDLVHALCVFASFGILLDEISTG